MIIAFFMYIGIFVVTFVTRFKTGLVGLVLIVVGAVAIGVTFFWEIIIRFIITSRHTSTPTETTTLAQRLFLGWKVSAHT